MVVKNPMKIILSIASVILSVLTFQACAADRDYIVSNTDPQQKIDVYNDGRNTYIQAVPGLVVKGATADGERLIIREVPNVINAELAGKKITLSRGITSPAVAPSKIITASLMKKFQSTEMEISERLNRLEKESAFLDRDAQNKKEIATNTAAIKAENKPAASSYDSLQKWDVLATDVRLANTFERWAQKAGWRVQWDASKHVQIDAASTFTGTFEDAIKSALMTPGIRLGAYPLEACVYDNTPPLIRITRQGEQTQECPD